MRDILYVIAILVGFCIEYLCVVVKATWWFVLPVVIFMFAMGWISIPNFSVGGTMMESFFALFAFGALGFWLLCAVALGICFWFGDNEWGIATGVLVLIAILVMWFGYGIDPFAYVVAI